jgi:UDP-GlcNAc:undecaprenyl-phosphate GlcNAc-1-phosphate transferase
MLGGLVAAYFLARELPFLSSRSDAFVFRDAGVVLIAGALICASARSTTSSSSTR